MLIVTRPGDFRFVDVTSDGKITRPADRTVTKSFSDFAGLQIRSTKGTTSIFLFAGINVKVLFLQRRFLVVEAEPMYIKTHQPWRSQKPGDGKCPVPTLPAILPDFNPTTSDASYLRIHNVSLGYRLPTSLKANRKQRISGCM